MSPHQLLVANLARTALILILVGLIVRRRSGLCWTFMAYLIAVLTCGSLTTYWPERFFTPWFYVLKQTIYDTLKLGIAAELAFRVFQSFPGAAQRARNILAPLVAVITLAIISVPSGTDYVDLVTRYQPQVQTGIVWLFAATSVLAVWYNIPLSPLHRSLLLGFTSYSIVFATLLNILRSFGYERFRETIGLVDGYAYLALVAWWAVAAWRTQDSFEIAPVRVPTLSHSVV